MANDRGILTGPTSSDIIKSWDRQKYPSFMDYLDSEEYEKWLEKQVTINFEWEM